MKYITLLLILTAFGCGSYSISKESFVSQLKEKPEMSKTQNMTSVGTSYYSNKLTKIKCLDKNGNEIVINPNKNTRFLLANKQTGKSMSLYFDTVYISGDSIFGLKSRIVGGKRSIAINDLESIQVKTEN